MGEYREGCVIPIGDTNILKELCTTTFLEMLFKGAFKTGK